jgi:hypothetical protein
VRPALRPESAPLQRLPIFRRISSRFFLGGSFGAFLRVSCVLVGASSEYLHSDAPGLMDIAVLSHACPPCATDYQMLRLFHCRHAFSKHHVKPIARRWST